MDLDPPLDFGSIFHSFTQWENRMGEFILPLKFLKPSFHLLLRLLPLGLLGLGRLPGIQSVFEVVESVLQGTLGCGILKDGFVVMESQIKPSNVHAFRSRLNDVWGCLSGGVNIQPFSSGIRRTGEKVRQENAENPDSQTVDLLYEIGLEE